MRAVVLLLAITASASYVRAAQFSVGEVSGIAIGSAVAGGLLFAICGVAIATFLCRGTSGETGTGLLGVGLSIVACSFLVPLVLIGLGVGLGLGLDATYCCK